jgi:hypothetical protein
MIDNIDNIMQKAIIARLERTKGDSKSIESLCGVVVYDVEKILEEKKRTSEIGENDEFFDKVERNIKALIKQNKLVYPKNGSQVNTDWVCLVK